MSLDNVEFFDSSVIVEIFGDFVSKVYHSSNIPFNNYPDSVSLFNIFPSVYYPEDDVFVSFSTLKAFNISGPMGAPSVISVYCIDLLCFLFEQIFNKCLKKVTFHRSRRVVYLSFIKADQKKCIENYRGIA